MGLAGADNLGGRRAGCRREVRRIGADDVAAGERQVGWRVAAEQVVAGPAAALPATMELLSAVMALLL
jgi:hypothetical protein